MDAEKLAIRADAATVLVEIRRAMSNLLSSLPGDVRRPTDLQRTLGVDYKLCWQVLNITRTEDPLSISQYVPGANPTRRLIAAVRALGVGEDVLDEVDRTIKEFQDVVATHSDDRRGFDTMIASLSGGDAAELTSIQNRRDAFRSESQIWGAQVETYFRQMIVKRSDSGPDVDKCFVNAKYGLRCLRQDVMPIIHGYRDTAIGPIKAEDVEPLDQVAAAKYGAPVLPEFSSQPVPKFRTIEHSDGWIYSVLDTDQIGRKSSVNMVFSGVARNMPMEHDETGVKALLCGAVMIAPTELGVVELLVHRQSFGELVPMFNVFATAAGTEIPDVMRLTQRFVVTESVEHLGNAKAVAPIAEVPKYEQQTAYILQKLGWNAEEFEVFRVKFPYPILHTRMRIACQILP